MCFICLSDMSADEMAGHEPSSNASQPAMIGLPPGPAPRIDHGLTEAQLEAGLALVRSVPTIDIHAHPGRFFMPPSDQRSAFMARYAPPFADEAVADIRAGGVSAVLFATVADNALLGFRANSLGADRDFAPGEAIRDHHRQLAALEILERDHRLLPGRTPDDVFNAHDQNDVACIKSIEGGDFIEERLDRIEEAHRQGVRAITIIHYRPNQIGDTQTEPDVHGGLTALGRETVREMNRLGIIVDLAHATLAATRDAVAVSTQPMMISHSNVAPGQVHPRLITAEHARLVTDQGGIIGAVPAGFGGQSCFADYIDTLMRMIDMFGIDHVAIGTDMDFTFQPVFTSYRDWSIIPASLLARGLHADEVAKVLGGNFLRIFDTASD